MDGDRADDMREIEMRVSDMAGPGRAESVVDAIRSFDPRASVRIDPATGIVHAVTCRDTLEVVDALAASGIDATAMTL